MPDTTTNGTAKSLERGACRVAYEVVRPAGGDAGPGSIVLLHGFGTSRRAMRALADGLLGAGRHARAVLCDLRGHGETRTPADDEAFTYEAMRDDVLAVLAAECAGAADLVGHSMGGQIALLAAIAAPSHVRSLATIGAGPCRAITARRERESWERAARFFERAEAAALAAALADAAPADSNAHPELAPERAYADARGADLARVVRGAFFRVASNEDACRALEVPTLVLAGRNDAGWLDPSRKLAALVPNARLTVLEAAGHWAHVEQQASCKQEITKFWQSL